MLIEYQDGLKVNTEYQYEDNDIHAILKARAKLIQSPKQIHVLTAVDDMTPNQLKQRLLEEKEAHVNVRKRILLIPCNLGGSHWVGILIEFSSNNQLKRNEYIDSLHGSAHDIPATLKQQIADVYPDKDLQHSPLIQDDQILKQTDGTSCGVYTIENLILSVDPRQDRASPVSKESSDLRHLHLEKLKIHNPEFYEVFYIRQRDNQPSVAPISEQLRYHQISNDIPFSAEQIQRIQCISNCIDNITNPEIKSKLLEIFNSKENYQEASLHLNTIRKQLQKMTTTLSDQKDKKCFKSLFKLLFNIKCKNGDLSIIDSQSFTLDYDEILAITQACDPYWEIEKLLNAVDLLINKQSLDKEKNRKKVHKQLEKINAKLSELAGKENKNKNKYNSFRQLYHSKNAYYLKTIGSSASEEQENLAEFYKKQLKIVPEEIDSSNPPPKASTLTLLKPEEPSILETREKNFKTLVSLTKDTVLEQLKDFFNQINTTATTLENYTDYCKIDIYETGFNGLINEMIIKLNDASLKESNDENIKNLENVVAALNALKTDFNNRVYEIRINFMEGVLASPNQESILFDTPSLTKEDINQYCKKLLFFHPIESYWRQDKDRDISNKLCSLIGEYKEKFLQKLKEKSASVDQFTFYQKNGDHYRTMMMDYKFAQHREWGKLKILKKEEIFEHSIDKELDDSRLNYAELAYKQYCACCKIADKDATLIGEQVRLRGKIALCLTELNQNLEAQLYAILAIRLIMQCSHKFPSEETEKAIDIYNKVCRNENGNDQPKFTLTPSDSDHFPQNYLYVQETLRSTNEMLNNIANQLVLKGERSLIRWKSQYGSQRGRTGGITGIATKFLNLVARIGLGIWDNAPLWRERQDMLKETKTRKALNAILQKALQCYDVEDHTGFITALSEEYEQDISILALKPGKFVNPEEIIKCLLLHGFRPDGIAYLLNLIGEILNGGKIEIPGYIAADLVTKAKETFWGASSPILEQAANELDEKMLKQRKKKLKRYASKPKNSVNQNDLYATEHFSKEDLHDSNEMPFKHRLEEMRNIAKLNIAIIDLMRLGSTSFDSESNELNNIKKLINEVRCSVNSHYQFVSREKIRLKVLEDFFWVISGQSLDNQDSDILASATPTRLMDQIVQEDEVYLTYLNKRLKEASSLEEKTMRRDEKIIYHRQRADNYFKQADQEERRNMLSSLHFRQEAQKNYQEVLNLNAQEPNASLGVAKCLLKLSRYSDALDFLTKTHLSTPEYWLIAATICRKRNDYPQAKGHITEALRTAPGNKEIEKERELIKKLKKNKEIVKNLPLYSVDIEQAYFTRRHTNENPCYKILSIDGGGIRGILPALWLCEIEKETKRPISHLFNMAAGTSTGAIIAAGLSVPALSSSYHPLYSAQDLLKLYTNESSKIFTTSWSIRPGLVKTKYTDAGRLKMFKQYFKETRLNQALIELVIPAANVNFLSNTHLFTKSSDKSRNVTFVHSLMATTAAPTFFPSHTIPNIGTFTDGGIHLNNPAATAYAKAREYGIPAEKIFMLSMGTGAYISDQINPSSHGQIFWAKNLYKIALPAQEGNADGAMYSELGSRRYHRWQVLMEKPIKLDANKKEDINELVNMGQQYIEELYASDDNSMNKLIDFLKEDPIDPQAKNVFFQYPQINKPENYTVKSEDPIILNPDSQRGKRKR